MTLFNYNTCKPFTMHSGKQTRWVLDSGALVEDDWKALAHMAALLLPPFGEVRGVPKGGLAFATALEIYADRDHVDTLLIADDVWSTGCSMGDFVYAARSAGRYNNILGVVLLSRGTYLPFWCRALFFASLELGKM